MKFLEKIDQNLCFFNLAIIFKKKVSDIFEQKYLNIDAATFLRQNTVYFRQKMTIFFQKIVFFQQKCTRKVLFSYENKMKVKISIS